MTITKFLACYACMGDDIEDMHIITPCLRFYEPGYEFPDECPKKARGLDIKRTPKWNEIDEGEFQKFWYINQRLGTRVRYFDE